MARVKKNNSDTAKKRDEFLGALIEAGGNITEACRQSDLSRNIVYKLEKTDENFAGAFREAQRHGLEVLEDEARRRAYRGTDRPVFHNGEACGEIREYSDTLLIFLLKGGMPKKYRDKHAVELSGKDGGPIAMDMSVSPAVREIIDRLKGERGC